MAKLGLVLSGGGIRGVSHIGMLKALEEHNLLDEIQVVVGTSAGSQMGAMFAFGYSPDQMKEIWFTDVWRLLGGKRSASAVKDWNISGLLDALIHLDPKRFRGALKGNKLLKALECYLTENAPCTSIRPTRKKLPLYIVSTDLDTGQETVWCFTRHSQTLTPEAFRDRDGFEPAPGREAFWEVHRDYDQDVTHFPTIAQVCRCSSSIPFIFVPATAPITYRRGGVEVTCEPLYTDGGVRDNFSLSTAVKLSGCDQVIGMFLGSLDSTNQPWNGLFDLAFRTLDEMSMTIFEADQDDIRLRETDIRALVPQFVPTTGTFDVRAMPSLYQAGYSVTQRFLQAVQDMHPTETLTWDLIFETKNLDLPPDEAILHAAQPRAHRNGMLGNEALPEVKYYIYRETPRKAERCPDPDKLSGRA